MFKNAPVKQGLGAAQDLPLTTVPSGASQSLRNESEVVTVAVKYRYTRL